MVLERRVLESESSRFDSAFVIEDHIKRELLSTDAILLAALALNLYLDKQSHLVIERQHRGKG